MRITVVAPAAPRSLTAPTRCSVRTRLIIALLFLLAAPRAVSAQPQEAPAITVEGIISPTTATYVARAIDESADREAPFLILRLDTPGGLLDATQDIVRTMLSSPVPIVVYVAPRGASAGSAGVFITLAAHVAAMAPATNIGAATPVQMGGGDTDPDDPVREKMISYAESYIETIAQERDRNVEWARRAVRDGVSATADEALEQNVIDLMAATETDLLRQLHGWGIDGRVLDTKQVQVVDLPMTTVERFFQTLFRPELIFILMLVAVYGLLGELSNPGAIFPGVTGLIALLLLLYTIAVLPLNLVGFALIALAIVLFITDVFVTSFGLLTLGGAAAFTMGSLMLFDDLGPVFDLSLAVVIPATIVTALFFVFALGAGLRAQLGPARSGKETLIGQTGEALTPIDEEGGQVFIEGEIWNAVSAEPVEKGESVRVKSVTGLTLNVEPASP